MDELLAVLQQTQHPEQLTRQHAEEFLQRAVLDDDFIRSLMDVAAAGQEQCPLHLRQLALVLITQQVRRRYCDMRACVHSMLMEFSFAIMACSESNLKNAGTVLLAYLFLNGPQEEREHITTQLYSVFNSEDLDNIYLASRCLCEILEEANFQSQVDILVGCDTSLRHIVSSIDRSQVHIMRNVAKVYRLVAFRVCDARLANDFTADVDDRMTAIFSSWMSVVVEWCSVEMDADDIMESLGILIEAVQFLSVVAESFPVLCTPLDTASATGRSKVSAIMELAWGYLRTLVAVYTEVSSSSSEYSGHVAHDGDRIEVGVFVMHLFELLKVCINVSSQQTHAVSLSQSDLNDLMSMLVQFMQLNEEQVEQYLSDGNDFVAADQDDSLELSLRHTGCDFVHEMFMSSPMRIFEAIVSKVESSLMNFYGMLSSESSDANQDGHVLLTQGVAIEQPVCIPEAHLVQLEGSLFALRCMGRKFTKRYLRGQRFEGNCGSGGDDENEVGCGTKSGLSQTQATARDQEVERLQRIISGLVNTFFNDNFLALATSSTCESGSDTSKLSILRGIISSLLSSYSQILPPSSLQFLLNVLITFSSTSLASVECIATRLYHCTALGVVCNLAVKHFQYNVLIVDNVFARSLESFMDICLHAIDSTIHIPLENVTQLLNVASNALRASDDDSPHFLPPAAVEKLIVLGLSTWSDYRNDPFSVEIAQEMVVALLSALKIDGHYGTEQLGSRERLSIFCQVYFPQLEEIVGSMSLGENSKNLGDIAIRVLVESMGSSPGVGSSTTAGGSYDDESNTIIHLMSDPTLRALCKVFELSLESNNQESDEGYRIDIGETLRSVSIFFSIQGLDLSTLDNDLRNEIITAVVNAVHQILTDGDEYNYSAVCGCLSHMLVHFSDVMTGMDNVVVIIQHMVQLIHDVKPCENTRNILMMGIVHIFCRNPVFVSSALGTSTLQGGGNGLAFMIDTWFELHPQLESRYNRHISTLGMLHVVEMYISQGVGEAFLQRLLQLVVQTISGIEQTEAEYDLNNDNGLSTFSLYSDDDEGDDDDYDDYGERSDDDEDIDCDGDGGDDDNPFAPAEMYISDLLDINSGGRAHVYVPDNLMFSSPKLDPLFGCALKGRLGEVFARNQSPEGFLMRCVNSLDEDTQYALRAFLE